MFLTVISLSTFLLTFSTNLYILSIHYTFVMRITQSSYDVFKENIEELISQYREDFSVPVVTDWKEYEYLYRSRLKGMAVNGH